MSFNVIYTNQAEHDLRNVYEYIAFTLLKPETAKKQAKRIMDAIDLLDEMPLRHQLYKKEPWKRRGLRVLKVNNYLAFYLPVESKRMVVVIRIMYDGRNIEQHLGSIDN